MPSDVKLEQSYRMSVRRAVQPPMPAKAKSVPEALREHPSAKTKVGRAESTPSTTHTARSDFAGLLFVK